MNRERARRIFVPVFTLILTPLHLLYAARVGYLLYALSGGISKSGSWTRFGGAPFAWTIPIQLPGTAVMNCCYYLQLAPFEAGGLFLVILGSVAAAYAMASLSVALVTGKRINLDRSGWKIALLILGVSWIPVPENFVFVYWITVRY